MSSLGSMNSASANLIASFVGTLRNTADAERIQENQANQKLHADIERISSPELTDDLETGISHGQVADRDADGRLPWTFRVPPQEEAGMEAETEAVEETPHHASDVLGERGRALDLDA